MRRIARSPTLLHSARLAGGALLSTLVATVTGSALWAAPHPLLPELHRYAAAAAFALIALLALRLWWQRQGRAGLLLWELLLAQGVAALLLAADPASPPARLLHLAGGLLQIATLAWLAAELHGRRRHGAGLPVRVAARLLVTGVCALVLGLGAVAAGALPPALQPPLALGLPLIGAALLPLVARGRPPRLPFRLTALLLIAAPLPLWPALEPAAAALAAALLGALLPASVLLLAHGVLASRRRPAPGPRLCRLRAFAAACEPRGTALVTGSSLAGLLLASPALPAPGPLALTLLGIALVAAGSALLTPRRQPPLPRRRGYGLLAAGLGLGALLWALGPLGTLFTAPVVAAFQLIQGGALAPVTPGNLLLAGAVAAAPPLLGWAAAGEALLPAAFALAALAFLWAPPHGWLLALIRREPQARFGLLLSPLLGGPVDLKTAIAGGCLLLALASPLPALAGLGGPLYLSVATVLGALLVHRALKLRDDPGVAPAGELLAASSTWLLALPATLVLERLLP